MILTDGIDQYDVYIPYNNSTRSWLIFLYYYNGYFYYKRVYFKSCFYRIVFIDNKRQYVQYYKKDKIVKFPCKKEIKESLPKNIKLYKYETNET